MNREGIFLTWSIIVVLLMFAIPYLFLGGLSRLEASYLFWVLLTALYIAIAALYLKGVD